MLRKVPNFWSICGYLSQGAITKNKKGARNEKQFEIVWTHV